MPRSLQAAVYSDFFSVEQTKLMMVLFCMNGMVWLNFISIVGDTTEIKNDIYQFGAEIRNTTIAGILVGLHYSPHYGFCLQNDIIICR